MPTLRLALAQINPVVGDLDGNSTMILDACQEAHRAGADLVAFPEMALTGYPIEDLALRSSFVAAAENALGVLARRLRTHRMGDLAVVVGALDGSPTAGARPGLPQGSPRNIAAVLHLGSVRGVAAKQHLPNYGVFDEFRHFVPGDTTALLTIGGSRVAVGICEDIWRDSGPVADAAAAEAGLLLVINASPYERNKDDQRLDLCRARAAQAGCTVAYVNMVGGQDELVFDGDSLVVTAAGDIIARTAQFSEDLLVVDLDVPEAPGAITDSDLQQRLLVVEGPDKLRSASSERSAPPAAVSPRVTDEEEVYAAVTLAVRDYVEKNGFASVLLGLSGGIDSALTAVVAADAIGADRVFGVSMPSQYSSDHSLTDAEELAARLGMNYLSVPIEPLMGAFHTAITIDGVAAENLQARIRGMLLMALSNQEGHLVLATGNKSELAVGYTTIYGDAVGGFAPLKDVPKTWVWKLARWRNAAAEAMGGSAPIPASSIDKPPSAELRPGQFDTDSLPDYALLDDILDDYIEQDRGATELVRAGFDAELVERILRSVDSAEYKRRQYPPGPKVTPRAFGRDRRLPITSAWRETAPGSI